MAKMHTSIRIFHCCFHFAANITYLLQSENSNGKFCVINGSNILNKALLVKQPSDTLRCVKFGTVNKRVFIGYITVRLL